jgi:hypothetical protein
MENVVVGLLIKSRSLIIDDRLYIFLLQKLLKRIFNIVWLMPICDDFGDLIELLKLDIIFQQRIFHFQLKIKFRYPK